MSARARLPWLGAVVDGTTPSAPADAGASEPAADLVETPSRRELLKLLGMGGLVLSAGVLGVRRLDAQTLQRLAPAEPWEPHVYIRIGEDDVVTITCHRSEMGQGIRTTMPMIIADEMEADWSRCRVEQAEGNEPKYGSQNTDGSTSIRDFLGKYREAGATVRALLEDAAAATWGVPVAEVRAQNGEVIHVRSGRRARFGALVTAARTLPMPVPGRVRVKAPAERRWEGKAMPGIDLVPMTTGAAVYGGDVRLPGMKVAVIARPPVWGGTVASIDDSAARAVPGVERIIRLPDGAMPGGFLPLGGVAVVASNTWAAIRGRDALRITWSSGPNGGYDSTTYQAQLMAEVQKPGQPGRSVGDTAGALAAATTRVTAEYWVPHLAHAPMEPVAAIARVQDGVVELWAPTQSPMDARKAVAEYLKVDVATVRVQVTLLGGAFGRKSKPDFLCEAAWLAREVGAPVRVQWTREDDLHNGYLHSCAAHRLEAGLDASGKVTAWLHRSAYPAIGATFAPGVKGAEPDELTNGASDVPWEIPNLRVEVGEAPAHTRIGWFRSVNAIHHGVAIGSFVDELARAAKRDSADFLLDLIGSPRTVDLSMAGLVKPASNYGASWSDHPLDTARARRVVELAVERSGWRDGALPRGRGRGIAMHRSFLTYVAVVAEVEVLPDGTVRCPRATMAVDAGFIANPDRARAQMEGAFIMALSNVLHSQITFANGQAVQGNFREYQMARLRDTPSRLDVHLVPGEGKPGGIGEPGVPPSGGAILNAIAAATGVRVRTMPVGRQLAGWTTRRG